ncbi:hypothetical protein QWY13_08645 [Planococcus sp. N017]|uniref:Uncharacterized protein n=1 Tax=Planococcus shenhongbingii TaxID=3058398 RepID=A0ABT8NCZ8_9BACL|nr:hypothetical protein [Planococcus sp. N017]
MNAYFLNAGIFIKALDHSFALPRDVDGHIRCRSKFMVHDTETDCINLDDASKEVMTAGLGELVTGILNPSLTLKGLKEVLADHPVLLYQTTLAAKKHLGL